MSIDVSGETWFRLRRERVLPDSLLLYLNRVAMHTNDALRTLIPQYVQVVQSADDGQYRVRSATFWNSLALDRGSNTNVAIVRQQFAAFGIDVSTPTDDLGREAPDAWVVLTAASTSPRRAASIDALPDSLFGDAVDPSPSPPDASMIDTRPAEPSQAAMTSTDMPSSVAGSRQPATPTDATVLPPTAGTWSNDSSDASTWVICPSCGATVLLSALFCPLCGLLRTHVREQVRQQAATTGEAYPALIERVRAEGWPLPPTQRQRLTVPREASVIIGIVVLGIGARLGDLVMPLLVVSALVVLGVSVVKPDILETVTGRRSSRQGLRFADGTLMQIVIVVTVIVAMYLLSPGAAMFGMRGGGNFP
jgi:hypothetical protein